MCYVYLFQHLVNGLVMGRHDIVVLVADDSESDCFFLKRAITKAGVYLRMNRVSNGEAAVDYLAGRGAFADWGRWPLPHLLILDLKMPGLDGFDVLEWKRQQPSLRCLPVIVLSSSDEPSDVNRAHALGASGYKIGRAHV